MNTIKCKLNNIPSDKIIITTGIHTTKFHIKKMHAFYNIKKNLYYLESHE